MAAAVSASNSVGGPTSAATRSMAGQDALDGSRELAGVDRVTVDGDALAVADEVRLRHRADAQPGGREDGAGHGHHAALAVGAAHQRAAQRAFRMPDLGHEALDAFETQADAEAPTLGEGGDRVRVGQPSGSGIGS